MTINIPNKRTLLKDYVTTVTILENISDAIFILSDTGVIQYINHSATNMLRTDANHLIGRYFDDFLLSHDDNADRQYPNRQSLIEKLNEGIFSNIETVLINNNYETPVIININVISDDSNNSKYLIVTAKDISQWKSLEKDLQEQQAVSISRDRLRLIGELSVGHVHEITQPLLALKMRTELLQEKLDKNNITAEERNKNFSLIFDLIKRIENTIRNVRDYAHQTEDQAMSEVTIDEVIREAIRLIEYELTENCIRFETVKENDIPKITTNKVMLQQVFLNLFKNSIDSIKTSEYSENIERKILVHIHSKEKKWLEIFIEDNGELIDENIVDKIFDPFFSTKNVNNNSGLGLTISRSVINSLGGDILITENNPDVKRFVIQLPIIQKDEQAQLFNFIEMLNQG